MRYFIVLLLLIGLMGCHRMAIYTDKDTSVDFKSYKRYAWTPQKHIHAHKNKKFDNDIVERNIRTVVMSELNRRGMALDTVNPDIFIDYDVMTEKKTRQEQEPVYRNNTYYGFNNFNRYYYNNYYYNYGGWNGYYPNAYSYMMGYKTVSIPYKEGTLIIDIVDVKNNKLIWKGYAIGEITDPVSFEAGLPDDLKRMFKKYPVMPFQK